jgi:hypothetical protein
VLNVKLEVMIKSPRVILTSAIMMATRYVQQITGQEHSLLYTGKVAHDFIFYHIFL